jgi:cytochrome P450
VIGLAMYFVELVETKRAEPDDRLLSALIQVESEGDRLSPEELIANTILLYAAGFETTSNLIGNGLRLLLSHPDQMALLRDRPDLLPSAILEMLRYDSPVQLNMRFVLEPVELFGELHPRGTAFVVLQGGANHDPDVYPDPSTFDVTRFAGGTAAQPLSFGWGAHHCLGAHLARAEGEIVFGELLARTASIELDRDALGAAGLRYRPSFTLRGLEALPVRLG